MPEKSLRPAWSEAFAAETLRELVQTGPLVGIAREWAWVATPAPVSA